MAFVVLSELLVYSPCRVNRIKQEPIVMIKFSPALSFALAAILFTPGFATAQLVDISDCRAIEDRLQRFDCYESLEAFDSTSESQTPLPGRGSPPVLPDSPPVAVVSPGVSVAPPAAMEQAAPASSAAAGNDPEVESFGREAATAGVRVMEGTDGKTELIDTIAALEQRMPTLQLITLQSGQKWVQMIDKRYPMRVGDEVRIYPSFWGKSYRLTVARLAGYIQVQRVD